MRDRSTTTVRTFVTALALVVLATAALLAAAVLPPAAANDYSPAPGDLLWMQTWHPSSIFMKYGGMDLVRGPGGDLWVGVGGSASAMDSPYTKRMCVARYSPSGGPRWQKVLPSPVDMEYYGAIAIDRWRNAVVVGKREGAPNLWVTTKVGPSGKRLWTRLLRIGGYSTPASVAVDSQGGIYVLGTTARTTTGDDVTLVKYTASGRLKWTRYVNGYEASNDTGVAVVVDPRDRVYVTGTVGSLLPGTDVFMARYTTVGKRLWKLAWDGDGLDDTAVDIDANAAKVAVAVNFGGSHGFGKAAILVAVPDMTGKTVEEHVTAFPTRGVGWSALDLNAAGEIAAAGSSGGYLVHTLWSTTTSTTSYAPAGGTAGGSSVALTATGTLVAGGWETSSAETRMLIKADVKAGDDWQATPAAWADAVGTVATSGGVYALSRQGHRLVLLKLQI